MTACSFTVPLPPPPKKINGWADVPGAVVVGDVEDEEGDRPNGETQLRADGVNIGSSTGHYSRPISS